MNYKLLIEREKGGKTWSIVARGCTEKGFCGESSVPLGAGYPDVEAARRNLEKLRKGKNYDAHQLHPTR